MGQKWRHGVTEADSLIKKMLIVISNLFWYSDFLRLSLMSYVCILFHSRLPSIVHKKYSLPWHSLPHFTVCQGCSTGRSKSQMIWKKYRSSLISKGCGIVAIRDWNQLKPVWLLILKTRHPEDNSSIKNPSVMEVVDEILSKAQLCFPCKFFFCFWP